MDGIVIVILCDRHKQVYVSGIKSDYTLFHKQKYQEHEIE